MDFKNPYVDFWKYVQDAHNLTELVLSRRDSTPAVKSVLSLMKLMGLQKRLLTRDLTIKCFKSSAELMRALLITREGERDYCGLSDDTRDCEVTAFTGSIKVCLMILVLVNCREVKRGSRLVWQAYRDNINSSVPAVDSAVNPNTELWEGHLWLSSVVVQQISTVWV